MISINAPRFELGKVVATPAALELLERLDKNVLDYVSKHVRGNWGDVCDEDAEANEQALADGSRIFSSYFWVKVMMKPRFGSLPMPKTTMANERQQP